MEPAAIAVKEGASEVSIGLVTYSVNWITEPGDIGTDKERALHEPSKLHVLLLSTVKRHLSFYGKSRDICIEHLSGYIKREVIV